MLILRSGSAIRYLDGHRRVLGRSLRGAAVRSRPARHRPAPIVPGSYGSDEHRAAAHQKTDLKNDAVRLSTTLDLLTPVVSASARRTEPDRDFPRTSRSSAVASTLTGSPSTRAFPLPPPLEGSLTAGASSWGSASLKQRKMQLVPGCSGRAKRRESWLSLDRRIHQPGSRGLPERTR